MKNTPETTQQTALEKAIDIAKAQSLESGGFVAIYQAAFDCFVVSSETQNHPLFAEYLRGKLSRAIMPIRDMARNA